jgi:hypothetical protein
MPQRPAEPALLLRWLRRGELPPPSAARDWQTLLAQARSAGLLATLAEHLGDTQDDRAAPAARPHLLGAQWMSAAQRAETLRELRHIRHALARYDGPVVLLKGAAYAAAGLPMSRGRMYSDTDLLVPRERLGEVESLLMQHGWLGTHDNAYDQRYYRRWMHELPPMEHVHRRTVIDVHHNIVPLTAAVKVNAELLFGQARPVSPGDRLAVLAPADMVLHSMTHLVRNEEFSRGLRDLYDIDSLLRHFGAQHHEFWTEILARSRSLGLERVLYHGLSNARSILATPVPPDVWAEAHAAGAPPAPLAALMGRLWAAVLQPPHPSARDPLASAAGAAMYVRAHWLRMPPHLLVWHLANKAFRPAPAAPDVP